MSVLGVQVLSHARPEIRRQSQAFFRSLALIISIFGCRYSQSPAWLGTPSFFAHAPFPWLMWLAPWKAHVSPTHNPARAHGADFEKAGACLAHRDVPSQNTWPACGVQGPCCQDGIGTRKGRPWRFPNPLVRHCLALLVPWFVNALVRQCLASLFLCFINYIPNLNRAKDPVHSL